jgi:NADPH2 dehydrogenase
VLGRASVPALRQELGLKLLSSSAVAGSADGPVPEEMTEEEIKEVMDDYRAAAKNALEAGFDGVQLHGGNGYLPDQFLQDVCNKRTDRWGGSIENRARFHIEAAKTIAEVVGPNRTGVRLSPWSDFNSMGMEDPVPTFAYLIKELRAMKIAALDLVEARIRGNDDADCGAGRDNTALVRAWGKDAPVMLGGGFTPETARKTVDEIYKDYDVAVLFGRPWTSNPDLPFRVKEDVPLVKYDRPTFYVAKSSKGYIDWDFSKEFTAAA